MQHHRQQPTRLCRPWDSPGKNTGVGCHFLLQCMKVKSKSEVAQSCPTPSNPMDCCPPGSSVHGIFQARVLEWGAIAFSWPCLRDLALLVPCLQGPKAASRAYTGHPQVYSPTVLFSCTALDAEVGKGAWKGVSVGVEGAWLYSLGCVFVYVRLWLLLVQERARGVLVQSCSLRLLGFFSFGHAVWHVGS